jgi:hypothetical protein
MCKSSTLGAPRICSAEAPGGAMIPAWGRGSASFPHLLPEVEPSAAASFFVEWVYRRLTGRRINTAS